MADIVYTPTSEYSPKFNTTITKISFNTGMLFYGRRIIASGSKTGAGSTILYTVPTGKTFFLLQAFADNLSVGQGTVSITSNGNIIYLFWYTGTGYIFDTKTYAIPIRFLEGEKLTLNSTANATANGTVIGYELDTVLIPTFV